MSADLLTQGELATRLRMSRRTLIRWLTRLEIRPVSYEGTLGQYPATVVDQIELEKHKAYSVRANLVRESVSRRFGRVITTQEAKRRARKGVGR